MGLINSIGAYFNKFLGGWTFGTQTDQLTVKNSVELEGTTGTIYEHTFQNKDGIVAHLDDITITLPTDTTGSVLFLNASNEFDSDGTYFNWDKVNKRLNLKGNSDTVGNIFVAQNLSNNEIFRLQNDRDIVIGGGSASTNTQVTINPFRAAGTSNYVLQVNAQGTNNFMQFINSNTNTFGGLVISRQSYSAGRNALDIYGGGTRGFTLGADGTMTWGSASTYLSQFTHPSIQHSTGIGMYFTQVGTNGKFVFENISSGSGNTSNGLIVIRKSLTEASVSTFTQQMLEIDGTFNLTNGNKSLIGINYNPTITALSGAHYGFLIRPATFNGIGLGATLPTANLQISNNVNDNYLLSLDRGVNRAFSFKLGASFSDSFIIHNPDGLSNGSNEVGILTAANLSGRSVFTIRGSEPSGNPSAAIAAIRFEAGGTPAAMQSAFLFVGLSNRLYDSFANQPSFIRLTGTVAASSGTGNFAWLRIAPTINQTGGTGQNVGIIYEPTLTSITGEHYGLIIRPSGTLNGIGHTTNLPTATWHVKGNSDSVGNMFVSENLSNTVNLTLANNGVSTFNFGTGGKVYIAGAVGSGDTLLEIRRTSSSSGGFIFRSDNGLTQVINTTNGSFNIGTVDNSNITFTPGTGAIILNTVPGNMTAFNTAFQVRLGGGGGVGGRWLNYGWNASYGSVLQAVQNASTPAVAPLSLNPFGDNVGIGAILPTALLDLAAGTTARASLRIRNGVAPSSPNDGDIWNDGVDLKVRLGGTTYTLVKV
jgi:hypothetical protein